MSAKPLFFSPTITRVFHSGFVCFVFSLIFSYTITLSTNAHGTSTTPPPPVNHTSLADYVFANDPYYQWTIVQTKPFDQGVEYRLTMTSQRWQPASAPENPLWQHHLSVYVPNTRTHSTALLFINGKNNNSTIKSSAYFSTLAVHTQSITADLYQVPNQPIVFDNDASERVRVEDAIIAYSWVQAMNNHDSTNILLYPMVKSAHQAMNSIAELTATLKSPAPAINQFVLSGASKRGWTTWLTAAIDPRVVGIVPLVIDVLNMKPSMAHHKAAYQTYSSAIRDYVNEGVMTALETGAADSTSQLIDPFTYKQALTMPKFIVNASGDQFFLPDSSRFYFDDLLGKNSLRVIPNTDHSLNKTAYDSLTHFYLSLLSQTPLPTVSGALRDDQSHFDITLSHSPESITLWHATNPDARDFRVETLGRVWQAIPSALPDAQQPTPLSVAIPSASLLTSPGWHGLFAEITYRSPLLPDTPLTLTTQVSVYQR